MTIIKTINTLQLQTRHSHCAANIRIEIGALKRSLPKGRCSYFHSGPNLTLTKQRPCRDINKL